MRSTFQPGSSRSRPVIVKRTREYIRVILTILTFSALKSNTQTSYQSRAGSVAGNMSTGTGNEFPSLISEIVFHFCESSLKVYSNSGTSKYVFQESESNQNRTGFIYR